MKLLKSTFTGFLTLLLPLIGMGQDLPQPSPKAQVMQRVGLTDITIEYSSPGVKGRKIFGELVPYGKMWRTGANKNTTIEFSQDVMVEGNELTAGKYSIFTVPKKDGKWTLIFNEKIDHWGTGGYKEKNDALRIKIEPESCDKRERMTFMVSDFDNSKAMVDLEWAKTRISFKVEMNTDEQALSNIENALAEVPGKYANAARYTLRAEDHYDKGLRWAEQSIQLEQGWYNTWIKAELLSRKERYSDALETMEKALELGNESKRFFYKEKVEKRVKELKKKVE